MHIKTSFISGTSFQMSILKPLNYNTRARKGHLSKFNYLDHHNIFPLISERIFKMALLAVCSILRAGACFFVAETKSSIR